MLRLLLITALLVALPLGVTAQESTPEPLAPLCPATPLLEGAGSNLPAGLIMTAFDAASLWVYDVGSGSRYPLPDSRACAGACRLSPDATELLYLNGGTNAFNRMRLDGAERSMVADYAGQVEWWSGDTFLVYTPGHTVYLMNSETGEREDLPGNGVVSVQPGGRFALVTMESAGQIVRGLRDLTAPTGSALAILPLAPDRMYANDSAWSPDGAWLAFTAPVGARSSELFGIQPGMNAPQQWTDLTSLDGPVRINGQATGTLSWSPDGMQLAFWVIPLPEDANVVAPAVLHVLDINTGEARPMCGYATLNHTPNPPRIVWSPDGSTLAFADDVPGGAKGTLITLHLESGEYRALTSGVAVANGPPALIAWGQKP